MLSPYARAHIRLLQIDQRFNEVIRRKNLRKDHAEDVRVAKNIGHIAELEIESDQEYFDLEVNNMEPRR
jgi:hypothetical protein